VNVRKSNTWEEISMSKHVFRFLQILVPMLFVVALVGISPIGQAQDPSSQNSNANSSKKSGSPPQPQRDTTAKPSEAKPEVTVETNAPKQVTTPADQTIQNTMPGTENGTNVTRAKRRGRKETAGVISQETKAMPAGAMVATEQADLSGTYAGVFDCAAAGVTGDTTLTITGNQFTLADGKSGRITAAKTAGYTAVAMQFGATTGEAGQPATTPPTIVSMTAKKSRDRLTLSPISGAVQQCSFMPAGTARNRATRRTRQNASTASGAETANPANIRATSTEPSASVEIVAPNPAAGPVPGSKSPQPGRTNKKSASKRANTGENATSNQNTVTNPSANPTVSNPSANPTASPSPTP